MRENEKIERFTSYIMSDVSDKKRVIETKVRDKLKKDYEEKELQYLEQAYDIIQTGLKQIDREKNELISKTLMENKVKLLNARNDIVEEVFDKATKKLQAYTKTEEYKKALIGKIADHKKFMGNGKYTIYINYGDKDLYNYLQEAFPEDKVFIERKNIELIGGCRLLNEESKMYVDDTLAKRLEEEKENFLMYCGIKIDEEVGD